MSSRYSVTVVAFLVVMVGALVVSAQPPTISRKSVPTSVKSNVGAGAAPVYSQPGGNVSVHARVVCTPSAGLYENPDNRRKIRQLPYGKKIGYRGHINSEWARVEVYDSPSEGHWGFIRRVCVGSFNSW
jgi:hypothetical protein